MTSSLPEGHEWKRLYGCQGTVEFKCQKCNLIIYWTYSSHWHGYSDDSNILKFIYEMQATNVEKYYYAIVECDILMMHQALI